MESARLDHHRGGSGPPLVLIHGIGHTWRGWKPMLPFLERDFDVLALDLPGHGHSPPLPPAGLAMGREGDWGRGVLLGLRWLARNAPAPEALLRNPVGRTLFAGPT